MKIRQGWVILLLFLCILKPVMAAGADQTVMEVSPVRLLPPSLQEKWFQYRVLREQGEMEAAKDALRSLKKKSIDQGIDNIDLLSAVLLEDAREALAKNQVEKALDLSATAQELSPNYVPAYFFRGRTLLRHMPWKVFEWVGEYAEGWVQSWKNIWVLLYGFGKTLLWIILAGGAAMVIFIVMIVFRYTPRLQHSLLESCRRKLSGISCWLLTGVALIGPLWFGMSAAWIFLWWLLLFWNFMSKPERWIGLSYAVLLTTAGLWLPAWIAVVEAKDSNSFVFLSAAVRSGIGNNPIASSGDFSGLDQNDERILMSLGLYYKRLERFDEARSYFERALETNPRDERLLINLGNLNFLSNRIDEAIRLYQKALNLNPGSVEAHFNLAQAYREKLMFEEGERHYQEAVRIDPAQTKAYTRRTVEAESRPVVDIPLTVSEVLPIAFTITEDHKKQADGLFASIWRIPLGMAHWVGLGFVVFILTVRPRIFGIKTAPFPCSLCGRTICMRCLRHIFHLRICAECHEMNKKVKRVTELYQIRHHKRRQIAVARFGSILLPGFGHFYLQKPAKGFLFAFAFFTMIFFILFNNVPIFVPYDHTFSEKWPGVAIAVAGLILIYFFILKDLARAGHSMDRR